ncbi:hypothetical protein F5Y07DRAFT_411606 [Xylaria sp. FL0933]|nr:hypothetical protein F5Y07DRAFT_411606 [Xylaria sp. FL0933]
MATWGRDAFSFAMEQMNHLAAVDPKLAQIKFTTIIEALHEGLPAFIPQNEAQLFDLDYWLHLQSQAVKTLDVPNGAPTKPAVIPDNVPLQDERSATPTTDTTDDSGPCWSDVEDAISDSSFTPPKYRDLQRFARLDAEGRRHVVLPPTTTNCAPPQQQRFIREDAAGRQHLLPPPGFHGAAPKPMAQFSWDPMTPSFEKKRHFKKPFMAPGGVSLIAQAVKQEREACGVSPKNTRGTALRFMVRQDMPMPMHNQPVQRKPLPPMSPLSHLPPLPKAKQPPTRDSKNESWSCWFSKGVFEMEEDLLYNSPYTISTF